jgi:hypothetical protein
MAEVRALPVSVCWSGVNLISPDASIGIPFEGHTKIRGKNPGTPTVGMDFANNDCECLVRRIRPQHHFFALARDESARNVTMSDPTLNTPSSPGLCIFYYAAKSPAWGSFFVPDPFPGRLKHRRQCCHRPSSSFPSSIDLLEDE